MRSVVRISKQSLSFVCIAALMASCFLQTFAQKPNAQTKRPLTHQDYDSWRSIQAPQISRDGKFVAYAYMAQDADSDIVVRNIRSGTEWRAALGYRPPAPPPDDSIPNFGELIAAQARLSRPVFTPDSRFVVFSIEPAKAELNKAKKDKKKPEDMPKNALGVMDLSSGQVARVERVKSFQVPEDASGFIAYLLEAKPGESARGGNPAAREGAPSTEPAANTPNSGAAGPGQRGSAPSRGKKKEYGTDLVLRNTATGTERTFSDVLDYTLSKDAKTLVYTVSSKNEDP